MSHARPSDLYSKNFEIIKVTHSFSAIGNQEVNLTGSYNGENRGPFLLKQVVAYTIQNTAGSSLAMTIGTASAKAKGLVNYNNIYDNAPDKNFATAGNLVEFTLEGLSAPAYVEYGSVVPQGDSIIMSYKSTTLVTASFDLYLFGNYLGI